MRAEEAMTGFDGVGFPTRRFALVEGNHGAYLGPADQIRGNEVAAAFLPVSRTRPAVRAARLNEDFRARVGFWDWWEQLSTSTASAMHAI